VSTQRIFHITHVTNIAGIVQAGCLWSDAKRRAGQCEAVGIGYSHIKDRRMRRPVPVAAGGVLGDYVPFNFCPRSVMLYAIHRGNVLTYREGQGRVVHLVSSVGRAVALGRAWAFTDRHAEPPEADYYEDLADLARLDWEVINANNWGGDRRRPLKQAEFLVHEQFDWGAVEEIGVIDPAVKEEVEALLEAAEYQPPVRIQRNWYYL
jgi:hypothetical protein